MLSKYWCITLPDTYHSILFRCSTPCVTYTLFSNTFFLCHRLSRSTSIRFRFRFRWIYMDNVLDRVQSLHIRIHNIPWVNVNEHIAARKRKAETSKQIENGFAGGKRFLCNEGNHFFDGFFHIFKSTECLWSLDLNPFLCFQEEKRSHKSVFCCDERNAAWWCMRFYLQFCQTLLCTVKVSDFWWIF